MEINTYTKVWHHQILALYDVCYVATYSNGKFYPKTETVMMFCLITQDYHATMNAFTTQFYIFTSIDLQYMTIL